MRTFKNNLDTSKLWYGVEVDQSQSSTILPYTAIGNPTLRALLPIQSKMKGCLLLDNGTVNYYLKYNDWTKKADGTPSTLDGTDGQVMVEIPDLYYQFEVVSSTVLRAKFSEYNISGFTFQAKHYVAAYEASLQRSVNKLSSVQNTTTDYRGGNNTSAWDALSKTLLGKPVTNLNMDSEELYAQNRGSRWHSEPFWMYNLRTWLYWVQYANLNSQSVVSLVRDANGNYQGGLGNGVTTVNGTEWSNFNSYNPFINCGFLNSLGNGSGELSLTIPDFGGAGISRSFMGNKWNGIENPFGHIWERKQRILAQIQSVADGSLSMVYVNNNPLITGNTNTTGWDYIGNMSRTEGWLKTIIGGISGNIIGATVGGSLTTYFSDYLYTNIPASGTALRCFLFGGAAIHGSAAGLAFSYSDYAPSNAYAIIGSRLCFY